MNLSRSSLLIPCYNAEEFLPLLREQVGRMQPAFDEVLLMDDASTDNTVAIAESMGFTVLRLEKNLGPGGARNALVRAAKSEWFHFHDVDDELAVDYLAHVWPLVSPDCDVVIHFVDFIEPATRKLEIRWQFDLQKFAADMASTLLSSPMPTMSSFIRKSAFMSVGGFNEKYRCFEDGDLHFRLAAQGAQFRALPEVLEWSLRHGNGAGANHLYCYQCRLAFLESYVTSQSSRFADVIAQEAERVAVMLLRFNDLPNARRAIALAESLGRAVPTTNNRVLKLLREFLPASSVLLLQDRLRRLLQ